jgi:uncharacterized protein (DUF362 family)
MASLVSVFKIKHSLYEAVQKSIAAIGGLHLEGKTVLIKPNLVDPVSHTTGKITSPHLVEAVIKYCYRERAQRVIIGEGPSYYRSPERLIDSFTKTGMKEVAERNGAEWVIFDDYSFRSYKDVSPFTPSRFSITEFAFQCEKIINIPVMKTHIFTKVTLAMKNLKGCLEREDKPRFHSNLARAVVELNKIVRPTLNIIDGTILKDSSPLIITGKDIVAVDSIASSLMGFNPSQIETVKFGFEAGLGEMSLDKIEVVGDDLKDLKMNFELPQEQIKRSFPHLDLTIEQACCGCAVPILSSLSRIRKEGGHFKGPLAIVAGKESRLSGERENLIPVGDCTKSLFPNAHLKGCPPSEDEIIRVFREFIE